MNRRDAENAEEKADQLEEPGQELNNLAEMVIGAAIEVHRVLGPGYLEAVYQKALEIELRLRNIPFVAQSPFALVYKEHSIGTGLLDFLIDGQLIVELKAVDALAPVHKGQVIAYRKSTGLHLGLLINFHSSLLVKGIQRIILS